MKEFFELNKKMWNDRVAVHLDSKLYNMVNFMAGQSSLNEIELKLLGDVKGKKILHLQCHFGQDSLSLARMGAKVTGIDFSESAINKARELNDKLGLDAQFICSDVLTCDKYELGLFDIVFTSYGTITWLPELKKWAEIINHFLKPGGQFLLVEFHPNVWMFDEKFTFLEYSYFNSGPIIEEVQGSYADRDADIAHKTVGWNHALDEVFKALLDQNFCLTHFKEYDYSPYDVFPETQNIASGYQIKGLEGKLPLIYSLMIKKNH